MHRQSAERRSLANSALPSPSSASLHQDYTEIDLGGVGSSVHVHSRSRSTSADPHRPRGLKRLWQKVSRSRSRAPRSPVQESKSSTGGDVPTGSVGQDWDARGRRTCNHGGRADGGETLPLTLLRGGDAAALLGTLSGLHIDREGNKDTGQHE